MRRPSLTRLHQFAQFLKKCKAANRYCRLFNISRGRRLNAKLRRRMSYHLRQAEKGLKGPKAP